MESLTVDDWIDVDSIDDIGFAKLRGWNLASLPELVCAAVCVGKMAAQERRCKEVGGGHRCHVKSIEFIVRLALGVISIGSITNVVLVYHC